MNIVQMLFTQFVALVSLATASGVLLHDMHLDKAFVSSVNQAQADSSTDQAANATSRARSGSNLHPHAEHIRVTKDQGDPATLPKKRSRRRLATKRAVRGFHGDNWCMPFAGEWM